MDDFQVRFAAKCAENGFNTAEKMQVLLKIIEQIDGSFVNLHDTIIYELGKSAAKVLRERD